MVFNNVIINNTVLILIMYNNITAYKIYYANTIKDNKDMFKSF